ncbi:shikimate dehydrogenase family protein (plasmid) [Coraliomargarita sp. W4R53]
MVHRQPGFRVLATARLEVWGDPIAHSKSPALHTAAYCKLGLDWHYGRRQVDEAAFESALESLDASWRGLSLTMPLKTVAFQAAAGHDRHSTLTGVANTLVFTERGTQAFNTDVGGLVRALREEGIATASEARIIGAGATATSALIALSELGAREIEVVARRPAAVEPLRVLGEELGVRVRGTGFDSERFAPVSVSVATLPGDVAIPQSATGALAAAGGHLFDVVYGNWPTPLSAAWEDAGHSASSGLGMLLHQALLQVRVFTSGEIDAPLTDEPAVLAEMRSALMGD